MESANELLQIVDYDGEFRYNVKDWMHNAGLSEAGFDFNVVTILGAQSSGKSTLINELFGCTFQVMDAQKGYSQTTKGLWLAKSSLIGTSPGKASGDGLPVIVLDVEGLDSKERGDRRTTYENYFCLFSLALADCLMINIPFNALGCFTSSGFGLLKTVMEANLELFLQQPNTPKTLLLFIVRDYASVMMSLDVVKKKIQDEYIEKIWQEINKPEAVANTKASDYFTFDVIGVAHRYLNPDQWAIDIGNLRQRWTKEFAPSSYSRKIPSDGFGTYSESIWNMIKQQSHLDIPNQKEMLSTYRCQELKLQALATVTTHLQALEPSVKKISIDALRDRLGEIAGDSISEYMERASRYQQDTCIRIKHELINSIIATFQPLMDNLLVAHSEELLANLLDTLRKRYNYSAKDPEFSLSGEALVDLWPKFNIDCHESEVETINAYSEYESKSRIVLQDGSELIFASQLVRDAMIQSVRKDVNILRQKQVEHLETLIEAKACKQFTNVGDMLGVVGCSSQSFWDTCRRRTVEVAQCAFDEYKNSYVGICIPNNVDSTENDKLAFARRCRVICLNQLKVRVESIVAILHTFVIERFQAQFAYDENEHPRSWESLSTSELEKLFVEAKTNAISLIPAFAVMGIPSKCVENVDLQTESQPQELDLTYNHHFGDKSTDKSPLDVPESYKYPLMDDAAISICQKKALQSMQQICRDAQHMQQRNLQGVSWRNIPMWGWLLLVALGWNEAAMIGRFALDSWLLLPFFLLLIAIAGVTYVSGSVDVALTSIRHTISIVKVLFFPVLHSLLQKVTAFVDPQPSHVPRGAPGQAPQNNDSKGKAQASS